MGDVNDTSPVFDQDSYNFSVIENSNITTIVGTVLAMDADGGANGFVTYCITGAQAPNFHIHQQNGNLRTQKVFDREAEHSFELLVTAMDGGNGSLSSNVTVFVSVEDENDNAPTFSTESSQQAGYSYVYGGLVGILVTLAAVIACFVFVTVVVRRRKRTTRHLSTVPRGQASPSALAWHPTDTMRGRNRFQNDSVSENFVLESINKNSNITQQFFHTSPSPSLMSSPTLSETSFTFATEKPLASQDPSRPTTEHRMSSPIRAELGNSRSPSYPQQPSGKNPQESDIPPPPYHTRSASEQQSLISMTAEEGDSSIYHDDTDVGKYLQKQKEAADSQIQEGNLDKIKPFKDEGEVEPLGGDESILSTPATISSHERSHMSNDSPDMAGYGRRLDRLIEMLNTDPAHPSSY